MSLSNGDWEDIQTFNPQFIGDLQMKRKTATLASKRAAGRVSKEVEKANSVESQNPPPASTTDVGDARKYDSFQSPESSNIAGAMYYESDKTMYITFSGHGFEGRPRDYVYSGVPFDLWVRFKGSESKGKFFSSEIRPKFTGIPVSGGETGVAK